jgi:predicted esterase
VDAALYWLQRAAREEGVDPASLANDRGFAAVRAHPGWASVDRFLDRASRYWAASGRRAVVVMLPEARAPGPRPAILALHEDGGDPADFLTTGAYVRRARRVGAVFIGVSGTVPLGPMAYRWSDDPSANAERIAHALDETKGRTSIAEGKVMLIGFSQGAQVALETAVRDPDVYRGAIAMSPSGLGWHLGEVANHRALARQRYVIAYGSFESLDTLGTSQVDAELLRGLGSCVMRQPEWFYTRHTLPPDLGVRLPHWIDFVLGAGRACPVR